METFFVSAALCPQRSAPSDASEMVNQLLFGELVELLDQQKQWRKVRSCVDDYEGWVDMKMLEKWERNKETYFKDVQRSSAPLSRTEGGQYIPFGAFIHPNLGGLNAVPCESMEVQTVIHLFMSAPYLWGGKSVLGVDCSGLTQLALAFQGVALKRDASLQAEQGETIDFIEQVQTGDLAFFDNEEGKIIHVGIVEIQDGACNIIHASGEVRRDALDHQGIFNRDTKSYSHQLRIIKRYSK
jgi:hypothetical protein